ncbi:MAG: VOC family protein [Siculibacillus sp.]|nr:VOC family protein [Siculibacillus sp.]
MRSLHHAAVERGIDHVVAATLDLGLAADAWSRAGFRLTPLARHPWGTENRLVQFDGSFIEILGIGDGAAIPEPTATTFSFGAHNRDFLATHGDGLSMLVLESTDEAADRAAFAAAGLRTFDPFGFERIATTPEGEERRVGFDLTFTGFAGATSEPDVGFFTCRQRFPENFWRREYREHPNGVVALAAVVLVAPDPSDFHAGLSAFSGVRELAASSLGLEIATPRGRIEVLTPAGFRWRHGAEALREDPSTLVLKSLRFAVADIGRAAERVIAGGFSVTDHAGGFVVADLGGASLAFEPAR